MDKDELIERLRKQRDVRMRSGFYKGYNEGLNTAIELIKELDESKEGDVEKVGETETVHKAKFDFSEFEGSFEEFKEYVEQVVRDEAGDEDLRVDLNPVFTVKWTLKDIGKSIREKLRNW